MVATSALAFFSNGKLAKSWVERWFTPCAKCSSGSVKRRIKKYNKPADTNTQKRAGNTNASTDSNCSCSIFAVISSSLKSACTNIATCSWLSCHNHKAVTVCVSTNTVTTTNNKRSFKLRVNMPTPNDSLAHARSLLPQQAIFGANGAHTLPKYWSSIGRSMCKHR